ncbi:hypothetical protein BJY59DRAFT_347491 [Rhodotorula toruloides]
MALRSETRVRKGRGGRGGEFAWGESGNGRRSGNSVWRRSRAGRGRLRPLLPLLFRRRLAVLFGRSVECTPTAEGGWSASRVEQGRQGRQGGRLAERLVVCWSGGGRRRRVRGRGGRRRRVERTPAHSRRGVRRRLLSRGVWRSSGVGLRLRLRRIGSRFGGMVRVRRSSGVGPRVGSRRASVRLDGWNAVVVELRGAGRGSRRWERVGAVAGRPGRAGRGVAERVRVLRAGRDVGIELRNGVSDRLDCEGKVSLDGRERSPRRDSRSSARRPSGSRLATTPMSDCSAS